MRKLVRNANTEERDYRLAAACVSKQRILEDICCLLCGLSDGNCALAHATLACYCTPPCAFVCVCVRACDPNTAEMMTHEKSYCLRQS